MTLLSARDPIQGFGSARLKCVWLDSTCLVVKMATSSYSSNHDQEVELISLRPHGPLGQSTPKRTHEPPVDDDPDQPTPNRTIDSNVKPKISLQQV